jgi:Kef-type K+ transport system membrane component KefB
MHFLRIIFNALPSLAGILLATLAFALAFVKELDEKLKDKRAVRWGLATALSIIGVSAFISDLVQRSEERTQMQAAEQQRGAGNE